MRFEKVHTIRDIYDGIRSGTADLRGAPHYFVSLFDDTMDDYTQHFRLYAVSTQFMERELQQWAIYRAWEAKFHRGLVSLETHPGHGGIVSDFDELNVWLDEQIKALTPIPSLYTATFRELPGQDELPAGILRALEVAWERTSAGFIISDRMQDGLVEYRFQPDSFEVRHVRAPGQIDVDLDSLIGRK